MAGIGLVATGGFRIWLKGELRVNQLNFNQMRMMKLGTVAVAAVTNRVKRAVGPMDAPAKALNAKYARAKASRWFERSGRVNHQESRRNVRDLTLTGEMLNKFGVRTVADNKVTAAVIQGYRMPFNFFQTPSMALGLTTYKRIRKNTKKGIRGSPTAKDKAWWNHQREAWMTLSPRNLQTVSNAANLIFADMVREAIIVTGGTVQRIGGLSALTSPFAQVA